VVWDMSCGQLEERGTIVMGLLHMRRAENASDVSYVSKEERK